MKFNKLILGAALVTPLFMGSCQTTSKVSGLIMDPSNCIYSFSESTITLETPAADIEFVENFKDEYIVFNDSNEYLKTKKYTIKRDSSRKVSINFTGESDTVPADKKYHEIPLTIKKESFKKGKTEVIEDAKGSAYIIHDYLKCNVEFGGANSIDVFCSLSSGSLNYTGATPSGNLPKSSSITSFSPDVFTSGTVEASSSKSNELKLSFTSLNGLTTVGNKGSILIRSKSNFEILNNVREYTGFKFEFELKNDGSGDYLDIVNDEIFAEVVE